MAVSPAVIAVCGVIGVILLTEFIFYLIVHYLVLPNISALKVPPPHEDAHETFNRILSCLDKLETYDFDTFFRGYFKFAPMEDIYTENFRSFLAWVTYAKKIEDVTEEEMKVVDSQEQMIYDRYNIVLKKGHNPNCEHCCMTYEDIPFIHRPLIVYIMAGLFDMVGGILYRSCGFRRLEFEGMEYWHHPGVIAPTAAAANSSSDNDVHAATEQKHNYSAVDVKLVDTEGKENSISSATSVTNTISATPTPTPVSASTSTTTSPSPIAANNAITNSSVKTPMVLFHGITLGWMNYFALVRALGQEREMFLIDVDAIKMMSLVFEMPTPEKLCLFVRKILHRHKIEKVHVLGHSFGSITAGWFVRAFPDLISNLTLLDPVSLLLGLPDVAYSFLYRKPTTFMESVIYYVAASELTIAHVLRRHFWWYKNILWLEDLAPHIHIIVGLAGSDEVANAASVREYVLQVKKQRDEERSRRSEKLNDQFEEKDKNSEIINVESTGNNNNRDVELGQIEVVFWDGYSHGQCTACKTAIEEVHCVIKTIEKNTAVGSTAAYPSEWQV